MKAFLICCFCVLCAYSFYGVQGCSPAIISFFGKSVDMVCESGESLNVFASVYSNEKKVRGWDYKCRTNQYITTSCNWSRPVGEYVNAYHGNVNFICPGEGYMVGMHAGTQNSHYNDRRFNFKCCYAKPGLGQAKCKWTSYVNNWKGNMDYKAPSAYFIAGAFSLHHDVYEARRWKFYICL